MWRHSVDAVIVEAMMQRLGKWHALIKAAALMRRSRAGECAGSLPMVCCHDMMIMSVLADV